MSIKQADNIEQPLGRILSNIGRRFFHLLHTKLCNLDIDRNYYALLLIEEGEGKITQKELADILNTDKVSVVRIIDYLSDNGYVKRVKNITDRRKYSLILSTKAKKALPEIKKSFSEINNIALKGLKNAQIKEFYNMLKIINTNLNKHNNIL